MADRPTVHDFKSGTLYSVTQVKALFGRSDQWIRDMIRAKKLDGKKLAGVGPFLISGESVRALYGSLQLAADVAGPSAPAESVDAVTRREFARAAELNGKVKGKAKAK
jgi:hypothetical protein